MGVKDGPTDPTGGPPGFILDVEGMTSGSDFGMVPSCSAIASP